MGLDRVAREWLRAVFQGRLVRRRLPRSVGAATVYVAPESQLKYLIPTAAGLDATLIGWARRFIRPGDMVWDIGANCGIFAMAAAGIGATVLAVEPDPFLASALLRTKAANPRLSVEVLGAAIAGTPGIAVLEIASGGRAANALSAYAGNYVPFGRSAVAIRVSTVRLDDLLTISVPSFVKIDIEGAELDALRGASKLLTQIRPTIVIEVASEIWGDVVQLLRSADYRLADPDDPGREVFDPIFNVLATPI